MLADVVTVLRALYPRTSFPPETAALYMEMLRDMPEDEVAEACKRIVRRSMYLPTVAEIRREVIEARLQLPTPGEAWEMVLARAHGEHSGRLPEPLLAAYRALGGRWAIQTSTNLGPMRHAFERDYDQRCERLIFTEMGARVRRPELPSSGELAADLPSTPVERRMAQRFLGDALSTPTDEEKSDAIRVLRGGPMQPDPKGDAIYAEAERIFAEGAN